MWQHLLGNSLQKKLWKNLSFSHLGIEPVLDVAQQLL
jgi:hypothetical protein